MGRAKHLGQNRIRRSRAREEWRGGRLHCGSAAAADARRSIRSTPSNFNQLEVAWRFKTDNLGTRPEYKLEGTPLMVKGVDLRDRRHAPLGRRARREDRRADLGATACAKGTRAAIAPRQLSGRGAVLLDRRQGRRPRPVRHDRLTAWSQLNAKPAQPITSFGKNGIVDLKEGVVFGTGQQIDLETGEIGLHSTPTVVEGRRDRRIVVQAKARTVITHNNSKGIVRAFDVRTGKLTLDVQHDSASGRSSATTRGRTIRGRSTATPACGRSITVDEEAGLVYLPVEDADARIYYGGHRPGNNLFGDSLVVRRSEDRPAQVALPGRAPSDLGLRPVVGAASLVDITVERQARSKRVALPSKQAFLYVFDRITGQPVWPIEERPVPQTDVPGEKTSPTQPFPTKPPAYARQAGDRSRARSTSRPTSRSRHSKRREAYSSDRCSCRRWSARQGGPPAAITIGTLGGGTSWPGAGFDPKTHGVYAQAANAGAVAARSRRRRLRASPTSAIRLAAPARISA